MIKNTIFVFIILLSVLFTCENSNLIKKSFLHQVNLKAASMESNKIETSNNTNSNNNSSITNSDSDQDAICSEAKDYINLMMDVEVSLQELMTAFEDHLKDIRSFKNSTDVESEKDKWQLKERDIVDYYVNKTAELLEVYVNLNKTINQIKTTYCAPKVIPVIPSNNSTNTVERNNTNSTNNSSNTVQNNTTNSSSNTSNNSTNTVQNNSTNSTVNNQTQNSTSNSTNTTQPNDNSNKESQNGNTININYNTNTKKEEIVNNAAKVDDDTSSSGSQSNVITIFTERLQAAASEAGLPGNYVQTRLQEIRENKMKIKLQRNMRRLKH